MEIDKYLNPELLRDNASLTVKEDVRHDFTPDEIVRLKDEFFIISNEKDTREAALELLKVAMKNDQGPEDIELVLQEIEGMRFQYRGIKTLTRDFKLKMDQINKGYQIIEKKLFGFAYYEYERMAFYDEDGHYVYDRPMKESERQLSINSNIKRIS